MDPIAHVHLAAARRGEREAAAAAYRLARACRRARRRGGPSWPLRLYARLWWASRPRAAAWTPGLFETPVPGR
ncbi:MAG TPA: hypothetical protein VD903_15315 [Pseudonocardia sp.]|nr:hypothetical protein [Pseudonocardia sp.]